MHLETNVPSLCDIASFSKWPRFLSVVNTTSEHCRLFDLIFETVELPFAEKSALRGVVYNSSKVFDFKIKFLELCFLTYFNTRTKCTMK